MYRVIRLYGDCEPWWFLDGWENDILTTTEFPTYEAANAHFQEERKQLATKYPNHKSHNDTMYSFWETSDQVWCEECVEYLQQYHSLMLLDNTKTVISPSNHPRHRSCQLR